MLPISLIFLLGECDDRCTRNSVPFHGNVTARVWWGCEHVTGNGATGYRAPLDDLNPIFSFVWIGSVGTRPKYAHCNVGRFASRQRSRSFGWDLRDDFAFQHLDDHHNAGAGTVPYGSLAACATGRDYTNFRGPLACFRLYSCRGCRPQLAIGRSDDRRDNRHVKKPNTPAFLSWRRGYHRRVQLWLIKSL